MALTEASQVIDRLDRPLGCIHSGNHGEGADRHQAVSDQIEQDRIDAAGQPRRGAAWGRWKGP